MNQGTNRYKKLSKVAIERQLMLTPSQKNNNYLLINTSNIAIAIWKNCEFDIALKNQTINHVKELNTILVSLFVRI